MLAFQNIAIIGRQDTPGVIETIAMLVDYLKKFAVKIISDDETETLLPTRKKIDIVPRNQLAQHCQLIIVVGGDGSILSVAPLAAIQNLPVLGINRGRLGFLTDIRPDKIEKIGKILSGKFREEQRFLLEVSVHAKNKIIATDTVLNDVVLSAGIPTKLVDFAISIDNDCVCNYRADGLIVATPTGSTAYALSGGGPILHPNLEAIVIVPMFPHNLSSRPIVIESENIINIEVAKNNPRALAITCDGRGRINVPTGGSVKVQKSQNKLRLIHTLDYNYFATLRSKLHWEQ